MRRLGNRQTGTHEKGGTRSRRRGWRRRPRAYRCRLSHLGPSGAPRTGTDTAGPRPCLRSRTGSVSGRTSSSLKKQARVSLFLPRQKVLMREPDFGDANCPIWDGLTGRAPRGQWKSRREPGRPRLGAPGSGRESNLSLGRTRVPTSQRLHLFFPRTSSNHSLYHLPGLQSWRQFLT